MSDSPSAGRDPRSGQFLRGTSGNPSGRRHGQPDKRTRFRRMLEAEGDKLVAKILELAVGGNWDAIQFCVSRLIALPREPEECASLSLPENATLSEKVKILSGAALSGELSPSTAATLARVLLAESSVIEISELAERVARLEASSRNGGGGHAA